MQSDLKHYYFYTHHHSKINKLTSKEIYVVPWFTVSPDMEIYRGDYLFACFRVCSHSVLDKINNKNRQTRCIVYGQQEQINYGSILSRVKEHHQEKELSHLQTCWGQYICCYSSRLFIGYLLLYHNISIVDLSPLDFLVLEKLHNVKFGLISACHLYWTD